MNRLAILGSYPEGPETESASEVAGKWSPWRHGESSPYRVWQDALTAIDATISRHGFIHVYIYFGRSLPVERVARVDRVTTSVEEIASPGPTFPFAEAETAHVWLRYAHTAKLRHTIPHADLRAGAPRMAASTPHPLTEVDWEHMYRTGLIFIEDPKAVGGWM